MKQNPGSYDNALRMIFLVLSPLLTFLITLALAPQFEANDTRLTLYEVTLVGSVPLLFYTFLSQGHIVAVFFRSIGNRAVWKKSWKRTLISTFLILGLVCSSLTGFFLGAFLLIFWTHFHYLRQHFGIQRLLEPRSLLGSNFQRRLDTAFIWVAYLVPIFYIGEDRIFSVQQLPLYLAQLHLSALTPLILMSLKAATVLANAIFWPYVIFCVAYCARLFYLSRKNRTNFEAAFFSTFFALSMGAGWIFLKPTLALINSVLLHSLQYYYLVGRDQLKQDKSIFWAILPFIVGVAAGSFFATYTTAVYLKFGEFRWQLRFFAGLAIAANLIHFYIDSYVWRRDSEA